MNGMHEGETIQSSNKLYNRCVIFEMSRKTNKFAISSRFREHCQEDKADITADVPSYTRYKTEEGENSTEEPPLASNINKSFSSRRLNTASLQNLIRKGSKMRKVYLQRMVPQYKPTMRPVFEGKPAISREEREQVRRAILQAVNGTPPKRTKLTEHHQKIIRSSFDKIVKQIKQRNCIRRDDEDEAPANKIEGHAASIKGDKHNVNQDSLAFSDNVYVICDGHGTNGKQISEFVSTLAHKLFLEALTEHRMEQATIRQILKKVELQLDLFGIDIAFSGCTLIAVIISENTVFAVNVGDSRAVLCRGLTITDISTPHRPDHPVERQRIEMCGGVIRPLEIGKDKYSGPNRIWAPGRCSWGPGLALSRAFGDKAARKFGVISEPQIRILGLTYQDDFIILGSDGLFDFLKVADLSFMIRKALKEEGAREEMAVKLVEEARRLAGGECDDVSCIVVFL